MNVGEYVELVQTFTIYPEGMIFKVVSSREFYDGFVGLAHDGNWIGLFPSGSLPDIFTRYCVELNGLNRYRYMFKTCSPSH